MNALKISQKNMAVYQPPIIDFDLGSPLPPIGKGYLRFVKGPKFRSAVVLFEKDGKWEPMTGENAYDEDIAIVREILASNSIKFMKDLESCGT